VIVIIGIPPTSVWNNNGQSSAPASSWSPNLLIQDLSGAGQTGLFNGFSSSYQISSPSSGQTSTATLPAAQHVQVDSALTSFANTLSLEIPVGPFTQSVGLDLSSGGDTDADGAPIVGQVSLVDSSGKTLATSDPQSSAGETSPQSVTVAMQNAPLGARLVVQILSNGAFYQTVAAASASGAGVSWSLPFTLDVQMLNQQAPGSSTVGGAAGSAFGEAAISGVLFAASGPGSFSSGVLPAPAPSVIAPEANTSPTGQAISETSSMAPAAAASSFDAFDGFNTRVPVGPLVSRSAGPLVPALAASETDAAPPVDRHERALSQGIETLGATGGSLDLARDMRAQFGEGSESVVTVHGAGGFPLKVTWLGTSDRADLAGLLGALPESLIAANLESDVPSDSPGALVSAATAAPSSETTEGLDYPNYLRAAFGLALGLGLTSGPLFPDLIASVRTKLPRWRFSDPVGSDPGRRRVSSRRSPRPLRVWIRGLISRP
jgi:hypothetical protein